MSEDTARTARTKVSTGLPVGRLIVIAAITAVLFAGGLVPLERIPEIPVDIDQKPFFIPYVLVALLPFGAPTLAVGLGAALGEGVLDVLEGYELDDPFGFVGYVLGFFVFGYVLHKWGDPTNKYHMTVAAVVGAFIQASFEAAALFVVESEALQAALISWVGNTVTHGIIGGLIPLVIIVPLLHGRIERFLGFAPQN